MTQCGPRARHTRRGRNTMNRKPTHAHMKVMGHGRGKGHRDRHTTAAAAARNPIHCVGIGALYTIRYEVVDDDVTSRASTHTINTHGEACPAREQSDREGDGRRAKVQVQQQRTTFSIFARCVQSFYKYVEREIECKILNGFVVQDINLSLYRILIKEMVSEMPQNIARIDRRVCSIRLYFPDL